MMVVNYFAFLLFSPWRYLPVFLLWQGGNTTGALVQSLVYLSGLARWRSSPPLCGTSSSSSAAPLCAALSPRSLPSGTPQPSSASPLQYLKIQTTKRQSRNRFPPRKRTRTRQFVSGEVTLAWRGRGEVLEVSLRKIHSRQTCPQTKGFVFSRNNNRFRQDVKDTLENNTHWLVKTKQFRRTTHFLMKFIQRSSRTVSTFLPFSLPNTKKYFSLGKLITTQGTT